MFRRTWAKIRLVVYKVELVKVCKTLYCTCKGHVFEEKVVYQMVEECKTKFLNKVISKFLEPFLKRGTRFRRRGGFGKNMR